MHTRPIFRKLVERLQEPRTFIHVLLGPRQVGKTTLALQASDALHKPCHYVSADLATLQDLSWLQQQWAVARAKVDPVVGGLLMIDEVQKIPHWSDMIKILWDEDTRTHCNLSVLILGSSPWLVQKGLTESLAGRFEILPITHWSYAEMRDAFQWSVERFLFFGGYPGAVVLVDEQAPSRWANYINDSLIETTISRDILLMTQVNKPALLRRLFQLACLYSGQIVSYTKMLGELQDAGNATTLAHYLDLLSGAGLVAGIQKFAKQPLRQKGSIPKLCVYNTALMTAQSTRTYYESKQDPVAWGRIVESAVGAYLLNQIRGTQIELFYWREKDQEIDFVLQYGDKLIAIEVKSSDHSLIHSGMNRFMEQFKPWRILQVGRNAIPLETFLTTSIFQYFERH